MSKSIKKLNLNNIDHLFTVIFTITGSISISAFTSLVGVPIVMTSSAIGLKVCAITVRIKKYKSIIKKKRKKHDKIALIAKPKLNSK